MNYSINIPEYEVSQFNRALKEVVENNFDYVRIRGEISEVKIATRGQFYLTLKDNESILSGVIWDQKKKYLKFNPEVGMEVVVTGKITTWSKFKTTYQIDIDKIELSGEGAILKLIEDRKKRLKAKGLFDKEKKKTLPFLPSKIGVITSPTGSVIHDIINRIKDRFFVAIDVWPTSVQGAEAADEVIQAIKGFNNMPQIDQPELIIIARGGGSTEDLMTFNDENLAFAVFESYIPIISAIGHETDTTIIDYVADVRASTPTAAAEKAVPVKNELKQLISTLEQRLNFLIKGRIKSDKNYLENLNKFLKAPNLVVNIFRDKLIRAYNDLKGEINNQINKKNLILNNFDKIIKPPLSKIELNKSLLNNLNKNIEKNIVEKKLISKENLLKLSRLLYSNSIAANLKKGYSILTKKNKIVKTSKDIKINDSMKAQLQNGSLEIVVKKIN